MLYCKWMLFQQMTKNNAYLLIEDKCDSLWISFTNHINDLSKDLMQGSMFFIGSFSLWDFSLTHLMYQRLKKIL